ncbi:hypothetical protein BZA05DRAFT_407309 [Tricharina praecox]|uniref:uncharacterized protein n=1 Tax=Tricharina praecox TaxID=43433 RepID=UPI00221F3C94|nr:uncharacterized protein BZA05DRAFT_407309 [Tricharina praecox]KAI5845914.1 hypothetical protein BZA05DRAFT_407309 [Tricharina praecox]
MQLPGPSPPSSSIPPVPPPPPAAAYNPEPILLPALKVGAVTGCTGVVFGGIAAVLRSTPTIGLFAAGTGLNCFALGSTYYAVRLTLFRALHDPRVDGAAGAHLTPKEKVYVSGAAGAVTGLTLGLVLRGRSNALPGALVWGLVGLGGQYGYNIADARHTEEAFAPPKVKVKTISLLDRTFNSRWNPIKKLSDQEYAAMLDGKLLAVEAELAITNEEIVAVEEKIRLQQQQEPRKT